MTSRFARLPVTYQIIAVAILAYLPNLLFPFSAAAQTEQNQTSLVFEIKNLPTIPDLDTIQNFTNPQPQPIVIPQPVVDPNIVALQDYLQKKGSPLAEHAETILQQQNWKLIIAIANGESTLCKHQMYNNCWGIGGAWNLRRYNSLEDGISDVDQLLTNRYADLDMTKPKNLVHRYVGSYSPTWVAAVSQTLDQLNQLAFEN